MTPSPKGPDPTQQAMFCMLLITLLQTVLSDPIGASFNGPVLGYHDRCLSTEEECLNAASAGHYPVCGDCTRFLKCDPLTLSAAFTDCPDTLLYDASLGVCNHAYNVDCRYQAAATAPTSSQLFPTSNSASDTRRTPNPTETWFTNSAPQSSQTPPPTEKWFTDPAPKSSQTPPPTGKWFTDPVPKSSQTPPPTETWFTDPVPKSSQTPPPTATWFTDPVPKSSQTPLPTALGTSKMEISSTSQVPLTIPAKVAAENPSFSQRPHVSLTSFGHRAQVTSPVPLASKTLITGQTRIIGQTTTSNQASISSEVPIINPMPIAGDTITDHTGDSERLVTSQARQTVSLTQPTATKTLTSRSTSQLYTENLRSTASVYPLSSITEVSTSPDGHSRATESSTASSVQQDSAVNATSRSAAESSRNGGPTDTPWARTGQKDGTHATGSFKTSISDGNISTTESHLDRNIRNKVTNATLSFITDSNINDKATATTPTTIGRHLVTITTNICTTNTSSSSRASVSSTASSGQNRVDETTTIRNADGNKSNLMTGSSLTSATGRIQSQEKSTTIVPRSTTKSIQTAAGLRSPTVRQPERHQTTVKTREKSTPANVKETVTKKTIQTVKTSTTNTRPTTKETAATNTPITITTATTNTPRTITTATTNTPTMVKPATTNTPTTVKETKTINTPRTIKGKATANTPTTVKETKTINTPKIIQEKATTNTPRTIKGKATTNTPRSIEETTATNIPRTIKGKATTYTPTTVKPATTNKPTTVKETKTINTPKTIQEKATTNSPRTIKEKATTNTPRTIKGKATTNTPTTVKESKTINTPKLTTKETKTTSTPPVTTTTSQSPACNTCVKDGIFGTCNVCSVYYLCRAGRIQGFMQCLGGLEWDDGLQACTSFSSTCRRLKLTYLDDSASNGG